jgi:hypothetical protein
LNRVLEAAALTGITVRCAFGDGGSREAAAPVARMSRPRVESMGAGLRWHADHGRRLSDPVLYERLGPRGVLRDITEGDKGHTRLDRGGMGPDGDRLHLALSMLDSQ